MMSRQLTVIAALGALAIAAAACEGTGSRADAPAETLARAAEAGERAASKPTDEAAATSPGKPLPPIEIDYTIEGSPAVGQPLEIRLRTGGPIRLTALNLALSGSERLQVPAEVARLRQAFAAANERHIETIRVTPLAPGRHYLSVLAEAEIGGRVQSRSVTIPIDVNGDVGEGVASPAPTGRVAVDADGERIISLPARSN